MVGADLKQYTSLYSKSISGKGLVIVVDIPPEEDLPEVGSTVKVDGALLAVSSIETISGVKRLSRVGLVVRQP